MPPDQMTDHDLLIELRNDMRNIKQTMEEIAVGQTANCATERAKVSMLEARVLSHDTALENLWNAKASKGQVGLLWGLLATEVVALIALVITQAFGK